MVGHRVMFGLIFPKVLISWMVLYIKMAMFNLVRYPKVSHLYGTRSLALDSVVGDTYCPGVVAVDGCQGLGVA